MINEFVQASAWILLPFAAGVATGIVAMIAAFAATRGEDEEMDCENCEVVEMCRKMFGTYWNDKSDGGRGCRHPPKKASLAAGAMENPETALQNAGARGMQDGPCRAEERSNTKTLRRVLRRKLRERLGTLQPWLQTRTLVADRTN